MTMRSLHVGVDFRASAASGLPDSFKADAKALHTLAIGLGYQTGQPLLGSNATLSAVTQALDDLVRESDKDGDVLLVTFSCHGNSYRTEESIALARGTLTDVEICATLAPLWTGERRQRSVTVILVVDACFSQGFADENSVWFWKDSLAGRVLYPLAALLRRWDPPRSTFRAAMPRAAGGLSDIGQVALHVFTAADKNQLAASNCGPKPHRGCYSLAFEDTLRAGDARTMREIASRLEDRVPDQKPGYVPYGTAREEHLFPR